MSPTYAKNLRLFIRKINVGVQKNNRLLLRTNGIILASFSLEDYLRRSEFFKEIFLIADISIEVILEMSFLSLSDAEV